MSGDKLFVVITFFLAEGHKDRHVKVRDVRGYWSKTILGKAYNPGFSNRAQGLVDSCGKGMVCLTDEGIEYIGSLMQATSSSKVGLVVFRRGSSHSFDRFLRNILKKATKSVEVADTYVAGNIFDNLLDDISKTVPIKFVYYQDVGGFATRSSRFAREYKFTSKMSRSFHDRFMVVDGRGYIIGPSLKDAADKKPAMLVILNDQDSKQLVDLFFDLWNDR